jgi:hypothetical protein
MIDLVQLLDNLFFNDPQEVLIKHCLLHTGINLSLSSTRGLAQAGNDGLHLLSLFLSFLAHPFESSELLNGCKKFCFVLVAGIKYGAC